jgi:5-methylcytosine-specific restriction protein A
MIREAFSRLMDEFPVACREQFAGHPLAEFIRHDIPLILEDTLPQYDDLILHASPGQGRWADAPWIAAFDPLVTTSAMRGYYPVYLFTNSMDAVYLRRFNFQVQL